MSVLYGTQATASVYDAVGDDTYALTIADRAFRLTLDEGQIPYIQVAMDIVRPRSDNAYNALDPTRKSRVSVSVQYGPGAVLTLPTLYVFARNFVPDTNILALDLTTIEKNVQTYSPPNNYSWINYQNSVKAICQQVLLYATGSATTVSMTGGATDKTYRVFSEARNLFPNPDSASVTGFTAAGSPAAAANYTIATVSAGTGTQAPYGQGIRTTAKASLTYMDVRYPQNAPTPIAASSGQQYTAAVSARASAGFPNGTLYIQFADSSGAVIATYSKSTTALTSNYATSVRMSVTGTAPPNTSTIGIVLRVNGSITSGVVLDGAQWMVTEGNGQDPTQAPGNLLPYFSGLTSDTADYHFSWDGDANVSESFRTPLTERPPEGLLWDPNTKAADYLSNILQSVGLRLFYDLDGQWKLADNGYRVAGQVAAQYGANLYAATESVSLSDSDADGFPMNADAVFLSYEWTDPITGLDKTASDRASTSGFKRPYRAVINKPYPGPGAASFLLVRFLARKTSISVDARPDFTARPGMTSFISLQGRPAQTGYVKALTWDLQSGRMSITSKGLVVALPGSIGNAPTTQTIGSQTATIGTYTN